MARPIKLNDKLQQNIVDDLKRGASIADACANNHLGESTYYRWRATVWAMRVFIGGRSRRLTRMLQ